MCGGKVRRERFCATKTTEIAAMAGQKIRVSGRASNAWPSAAGKLKINNGYTIKAKMHAEIGRIAYLSIIAVGVGPLKAVRDAPGFGGFRSSGHGSSPIFGNACPGSFYEFTSRWFKLSHGHPSDPRLCVRVSAHRFKEYGEEHPLQRSLLDEEPPAHHLASGRDRRGLRPVSPRRTRAFVRRRSR